MALPEGARFRIEIDGQQQLDLAFTGFGQDLGDWSETWEQVGDYFYKREKQHFRIYNFAPLSERYAARKRKVYGKKPILRATDELWEALTTPDAQHSMRIITPRSISLGTTHGAAPYHHSTEPRTRLPRRSLVDIQEQDRRQYRSIVQRAAVAKARQRGFRTTGVVQGELIK